MNHLKNLTEINGVSGNEEKVCEYISKSVFNYVDNIFTDKIGSLIAYKKGLSLSKKIMLAAHVDEVGFIIVGFNEDGTLKFRNLGGFDNRTILGKRVVVGENEVLGVIGVKPIHLTNKTETNKVIQLKSLAIDIGATNVEEAKELVKLGDYVAFYSEYVEFGNGFIKAKALDDRVGCAAIMEILKESYEYDVYGCFVVKEEIGHYGAITCANFVKPDIAFVLEGTTCSDVPNVSISEVSTLMKHGPAITIIDKTSYSDKYLVDFVSQTAEKYGIPFQFKNTVSGGNDAGKIKVSGNGVITCVISVPVRYIHSPVSVIYKDDYLKTVELTKCVLKEINNFQNNN